MSIKEKVIKGVVWTAIQNWGSQAISLIIFFVLARLLEPEAFGLLAMANVFLALMQIFLDQGFAQALIQRQELEPEHLDTAFWTNIASGSILTILGVMLSSSIAALFDQAQLTAILQWLSFVFLIGSFSNTQQAILERKFAFKSLAVRWLVAVSIGGTVGITMALTGFGVWSLVGQQLAQELAGVLTLWTASRWRPGLKFSRSHFRQLFGFGINILAFNILVFINQRSDDFLIGYFLGPIALGFYSIAYRVLEVMTQLLIMTSTQVALPTFSRLRGDRSRLQLGFYKATQLTSLIAFPTFLGMAALAVELVRVLFGDRWLPSVPVMQVLALVGIVRAVTFFKGSIFIAMGKPSWRLWLGLLDAIVNFLGFILVVRWGILAVAIVYAVEGYVFFPIGQWAVGLLIHTPFAVYLRQFVVPLASSLIMTVVILSVRYFLVDWLSPLMMLIVGTTIGAAIYLLSIRLLSPRLFQELLEIVRLIMSRSNRQNA